MIAEPPATAADTHAATREALARLKPCTPDYALLPLVESFTWSESLGGLDSFQWYVVVFRSVRSDAADTAVLTWYDDRAHEEAESAPGFLHYFKGCLNERRECLSFCVWESQGAAVDAARRSRHRAAVGLVDTMYTSYRLERYYLEKAGTGEPLTIRRVVNEQYHGHVHQHG
jgi:hypothetical protein